MSDLIAIAMALVGAMLPLFCSGLIPNGYQRWAAAMFAAVGIVVFVSHMTNPAPSPFSIGMSIGFVLATAKLATGLRFL